MDGWLKWLVAVTCVTVLAATGWWGWSEWGAAQERAAAEQAEARAASIMRATECQADVAAWDSGQRAVLVQTYGEHAESIVETCRWRYGAKP